MAEQITIWLDADGYHLVKGSEPTKELVYPEHTANAFYTKVVRKAVEEKKGE